MYEYTYIYIYICMYDGPFCIMRPMLFLRGLRLMIHHVET